MSRQTTLNVSLTPRLRRYVRAKVNSGKYESASEVIRESLRALQEREQAPSGFWADVRGKLAVARRQVAEGKTIDGELAMNDILAELDDRPAKRRKAAR
jgi:antitoxin ParD1/3/4